MTPFELLEPGSLDEAIGLLDPDDAAVRPIAGGTALYASNPLQDIFRDSTAGASHLSLTWQRAAPPYGQLRLGQSVDYNAI